MRRDADEMLKKLTEDDFLRNMHKELETMDPEIEPDPSLAVIKKLLGEVPAQIEYLKLRGIEVKKRLQELKLLIKAKKYSLEISKSRIRQDNTENYQKELKKYILNIQKLYETKDVVEGGTEGKEKKTKLPNAVLQEIARNLKPDKPTQNMLDDIANLKTENLQKEIIVLERKVLEYEELHEVFQVIAEKFENKNLATRAHKGLLEAELRNQNN